MVWIFASSWVRKVVSPGILSGCPNTCPTRGLRRSASTMSTFLLFEQRTEAMDTLIKVFPSRGTALETTNVLMEVAGTERKIEVLIFLIASDTGALGDV